MKGWTPDGQPVELTGWQADMVRLLLHPGDNWAWVERSRKNGWLTVMATAARYSREHPCRCVPDGGVILTGGCPLHDPGTGALAYQPTRRIIPGLVPAPETLEPPDAREDCGLDCA